MISPQNWGPVFVSKHHYADELAKAGEQVYFVNSPSISNAGILPRVKLSFVRHRQYRIGVIDYTIPYLVRRMHNQMPFVYEMYMQLFVVTAINGLCKNIKEVWIFNADFVHDIKKIRADKHIVFYADMVHWNQWKKQLKNADLFVTISEYIFKKCSGWCSKSMLIDHGLAEEFCIERAQQQSSKDGKIHAGYIGNLMIGEVLDMDCFELLVKQYPQVQFHFVGPYESASNNLGSHSTERITRFINTLKSAPNCTLYGPLSKSVLAEKINSMDVLLVGLRKSKDHNAASNSHKILEYLSTGKVIVSYAISSYDNRRDLIEFAEDDMNAFSTLFGKVISHLDVYNSSDKQQLRIKYALQYTYEKNIQKIRENLYKQAE